MAWPPAAAKLVVNVAVPPVPTATVPRTTLPSLNVTVPVGVPAPGATAATVAVKVTAWPVTAGLTDDPRATVVAARLTVTVAAAEVLSAKPLVPAEGGGQRVGADAQRHREGGLAGGVDRRGAQDRGAVAEGDGADRRARLARSRWPSASRSARRRRSRSTC